MTEPLDAGTAAFLDGTCVFCQPWWLEAVAPGHWGVAVVRRGEEVAAVWPYAYKIRLGRYRLLEIPDLTFYLGPWFRASQAGYASQLAEEKELMTELVEALPPFAAFQQWIHPRVTNWLPLFWKGFTETTRYTYLITDTSDLDVLWAATRENVRREIRKARKQVEIVDEADVARFLRLHRMTFGRQGLPLPYSESTLHRVDAACADRGARKVLCAVGRDGRVHAGAYLVCDATTVYALLRGSDPALRVSGAGSLVMWSAIEFASAQGKAFDFIGSWVEPIERFVRAFGGSQTPFFEVTKLNSRVVSTYRRLWRLAHGRG